MAQQFFIYSLSSFQVNKQSFLDCLPSRGLYKHINMVYASEPKVDISYNTYSWIFEKLIVIDLLYALEVESIERNVSLSSCKK